MKKCKEGLRIAALICLVLAAVLFTVPVPARAEAALSKTYVILYLGQDGSDTCTLSVSGIAKSDTVAFSSKNEAVASVSADGVIKAVAPGKTTVTCTVTAKDGTKTQKKATVRVYDNIKSLTIALKDAMPNALRKNTAYQWNLY